jgi:hypothetical protein
MSPKPQPPSSSPSIPTAERKILIVEIEPGGAIPVRGMPGVAIWEAHEFSAVEKVKDELRRMQDGKSVEFPDVVAFDSVTMLVERTLGALALEGKIGGLWTNRKLLVNDRWAGYNAMTTITNRLLMEIRELQTVSIFICHEGKREAPDGSGIKLGPDVNPGVGKTIVGWTDILAHLGRVQRSVETPQGKIPAGTRRLRLVEDDVYMAKARVPRELQPIKEVIVDPVLDDLLAAVKMPEQKMCRITLYGAPGVGKTTLAAGGMRTLGKEETANAAT